MTETVFQNVRRLTVGWGVAALLLLMLAACDEAPAGPDSLTTLRVVNNGPQVVQGLVLLFPEERVEFGDVAVGQTTSYKPVIHGVYRYSAFAYRVNGAERVQPVIDWVGESPMEGESFTYTIAVTDPTANNFAISLVGVQRDR